MANKRQSIDNFFKENLSGFELSENKGNWELLDQLLVKRKAKNKNRKWLLFILCFIVIPSLGLFLVIPGLELKEKTNKLIEPINTSLINEKNSFINQQAKSKTLHSNNEEKAYKEYPQVIRPEMYLTKPQPKFNPNGTNNNVVQDTNDSQSFFHNQGQHQDSTNLSVISNEAMHKDSIPGTQSDQTYDSIKISKKKYPATNATMPKEPIPAKIDFLNFNLYTGINIYSTSSSFKNKQNISSLLGLELTHQFSKNLSIGLAGLYSLQGGYHLNDTTVKESYFLDKNVSQQTIHIHHLHKLYFPLTFYYTIAKKHSILGAIQGSYLVNTNGNYKEVKKTQGNNSESQKNNANGYMDGIKSTNLAVSMGYKYTMSKRFDFSTRFSQDITESYYKGYFYGVNTKPSWSIQTFFILKF